MFFWPKFSWRLLHGLHKSITFSFVLPINNFLSTNSFSLIPFVTIFLLYLSLYMALYMDCCLHCGVYILLSSPSPRNLWDNHCDTVGQHKNVFDDDVYYDDGSDDGSDDDSDDDDKDDH